MSDALINTAKTVNVKVKDDGTVKVLDFGLAKAFQPDASGPNILARSAARRAGLPRRERATPRWIAARAPQRCAIPGRRSS